MSSIVYKFSAFGSAYGVALGTGSESDSDCQDTEGFKDIWGYECSGWTAYDCLDFSQAATRWYHQFPTTEMYHSSNGQIRASLKRNIILLGGDPFDQDKYSNGLAAGGVDGFDLSDTPFYPEIFYEGQYYPICGIGLNDEAVASVCREIHRDIEPPVGNPQPIETPLSLNGERFTYGARVVKTNAILEQDAMPVGACLPGESLDGCTAGENAFGDLEALDGRCKKGNPVGVQIVCQRQCRKFGQRVYLEKYRQMVDQMGIPMEHEQFYGLDACKPFLKNTTTYYLEDETQKVDELYFGSKISEFWSLLDVMSRKCSANVVELICHSLFKECKEVDFEDPVTGGKHYFKHSSQNKAIGAKIENYISRNKPRTSTFEKSVRESLFSVFVDVFGILWLGRSSIMLPSLLCQSECERHKAIWDECFENIKKDFSDKKLFESNMQAMSNLMSDVHQEMTGRELPKGQDGTRSPFSLLDCDAKGGNAVNDIPEEEVAASWILGRYPQTYFDRSEPDNPYDVVYGIVGWAFPRYITSEMLYPQEFSTYTGPDGVSYEVPCTIPSQSAILKETTCSLPFVNSILPETNRACVYSCPMHQFSEAEYTTMWAIFVVIGMCSFALNLFTVTTWKLAGWYQFRDTPFQLKSCVFLGLLYGIVETIPTLILKFDLPCKHPTEEEVGSNAWCYVNRGSQYILLGIMVNLCTLTIMIYRALVNATGHENNPAVNVFSTAVPILFMAIAYGLDTGEADVENYYLNVSRHGFNCSMRFSTMLEEWLVLWLPFGTACVLTAVFTVVAWWKIGDIQRALGTTRPGASNVQSQGQMKLAAQRRRLIRIAATVSACLLLSVALVGQATVEQTAWENYENNKLDCLIKSSGTRNFKDYGFDDKDVVEDICSVPVGHRWGVESANVIRYFQGKLELLEAVGAGFALDGAPSFHPTCGWYPDRSTTSLVCNTDELVDLYRDTLSTTKELGELVNQLYSIELEELVNQIFDLLASESFLCECSCSDLFEKINKTVERPSPIAMILSFASQSLVAGVVAINLGLRDDNLNLWRKFYKRTFTTARNTVAVTGPDDGFQFDSKAYERDPSSASD